MNHGIHLYSRIITNKHSINSNSFEMASKTSASIRITMDRYREKLGEYTNSFNFCVHCCLTQTVFIVVGVVVCTTRGKKMKVTFESTMHLECIVRRIFCVLLCIYNLDMMAMALSKHSLDKFVSFLSHFQFFFLLILKTHITIHSTHKQYDLSILRKYCVGIET